MQQHPTHLLRRMLLQTRFCRFWRKDVFVFFILFLHRWNDPLRNELLFCAWFATRIVFQAISNLCFPAIRIWHLLVLLFIFIRLLFRCILRKRTDLEQWS